MQLARLAERPGDAGEGLADLHLVDADAARADRLDDERDRAGLGVPVGERQRESVRPSASAARGRTGRRCAALATIGDFTVNSTMPSARSIFSTMVCGAWPRSV